MALSTSFYGCIVQMSKSFPQTNSQAEMAIQKKKGRKRFARQDYEANKMFSEGDQTNKTRV